MALVLSENFDNVVVPGLPTDITVVGSGASLVTDTTHYISSPNSLYASSTAVTHGLSAYLNKSDGSSGNISVSASFYFSPGTTRSYAYLFIGIGGQWVFGAGNDNSYGFYLDTVYGVGLVRHNSGTQTDIKDPSSPPALSTSIWYTATLIRNGNTFFCSVQRSSDLNWINSSGSWQLQYTNAVVYTDVSPLPLSTSYGGAFLAGDGTGSIWCDNLIVRDQVTTLPAGVLKGLNIALAFSYGFPWTNWSSSWSAADGVKAQIDLAKSIGCNCVRLQGFLCYVWQGYYTLNQYCNYVRQAVSYCRSVGMYFYLMEYSNPGSAVNIVPYDAGSNLVNIFNTMATAAASVAGVLGSYPNVLGYDFYQEFNGSPTSSSFGMFNGTTSQSGSSIGNSAAIMQDLVWRHITAIRAVAPNMPLALSFNGIADSTGWTTAAVGNYAYLFDYIDQHLYYPTATPIGASDSQAIYTNVGTSGKKLLIGEFGDSYNHNPRTAQITSVWPNVVQATYTGQPGCIGGLWWAAVQYDTAAGANDWGMWADTIPLASNARADVEPQFAALTAASYSFGSNFRRRRR